MGWRRRTREHGGFWVWVAVVLIKPFTLTLTRREWSGRENIPATGGVIIAMNHVSYIDPFLTAHFVHSARRTPRFMVKRELFAAPVTGWILAGARQIPVDRDTDRAIDALRDARAALAAGMAVVVYPEGTMTRDPDWWPMLGRTGVARLALATGVPVIPVAQWGAQQILGRDRRPRPLPRKRIRIVAGPPVDLSAYGAQMPTGDVLRAVTDAVMGRIRDQVAQINGRTPPAGFLDPRTGRRLPPATRERSA